MSCFTDLNRFEYDYVCRFTYNISESLLVNAKFAHFIDFSTGIIFIPQRSEIYVYTYVAPNSLVHKQAKLLSYWDTPFLSDAGLAHCQ